MQKKRAIILARLALSLTLIVYVVSRTDLSSIYVTIIAVDPVWIVLAFMLLGIGKLLTSCRWKYLLAAQNITIPLWKLISSLYVGQFFNNFLPSTIGGDSVRLYDTISWSGNRAGSITALFFDRLFGVFALVVLASAGLLFSNDSWELPFSHIVVIGFSFCLVVCVLLFAVNGAVASWSKRQLRPKDSGTIEKWINRLSASFHEFKRSPKTLFLAFGISLTLQITVVLFYFSVSNALKLEVPVSHYFVIVPVILIFLLLPVSINGIGLREAAFVFFLSQLNVAPQEAIALAWLEFGLRLLHGGGIGAIIFVSRSLGLKPIKTSSFKG